MKCKLRYIYFTGLLDLIIVFDFEISLLLFWIMHICMEYQLYLYIYEFISYLKLD